MYELTVPVRVVVPGYYNGLGHRRLPFAEKGDVIEVAGGGYAESLVADGYATDDLAQGVEAEAEVEVVAVGSDSLNSHAVLTEVAAVDRLAEVKGLGVATAKKLVALGLTSVEALVAADTAVVAEGLSVTEKRVQGWQEAATTLLNQQEGA
jgi:predicted flap endonuclease-1-like 5' DNA nuclease